MQPEWDDIPAHQVLQVRGICGSNVNTLSFKPLSKGGSSRRMVGDHHGFTLKRLGEMLGKKPDRFQMLVQHVPGRESGVVGTADFPEVVHGLSDFIHGLRLIPFEPIVRPEGAAQKPHAIDHSLFVLEELDIGAKGCFLHLFIATWNA